MTKGNDLRLWSLIISLIFLTLGLINSIILTPLNRLWFNLEFLEKLYLHYFRHNIFLIVTPTGILLRLFGKDVINLKYNNDSSSRIKNVPKTI